MSDEEFRLPGTSYEELVKIISGYGQFDNEVRLEEVARVAGVSTTAVSRDNAFLVSVSIVEGGKRKAITPLGRGLARSLEHNIPDEIARHWRQVISGNVFFQKILSAVRIRRGMDGSTLQAHIAYSAGQKKSAYVMAGSGAIVHIMEAARIIRDDNGKFVATDDVSQELPEEVLSDPGSEGVPPLATTAPVVPTPARQIPQGQPSSSVNVTVQLQIHCTPEQIDDVSGKLRNLIKSLSEIGEPPESQ